MAILEMANPLICRELTKYLSNTVVSASSPQSAWTEDKMLFSRLGLTRLFSSSSLSKSYQDERFPAMLIGNATRVQLFRPATYWHMVRPFFTTGGSAYVSSGKQTTRFVGS
ncbi:uncharacterized protein CLUP02_12472 [Colletotrichum lupini]|uniref:Uncharacterized protein n=1 Tax=Colletotrichum lupini TaxID=145971 RepID=A0A9Q8T0Z4_9PEZI|nr:uncharacterized protein CLUP02_12472 [Colletotrichum lupini]UQC86970.1 hypothetical protein CLUP02_12472 [Colletotrichum lupini]